MSHTPGPWEARPADGHVVLNGSSIYAVRDVPSDRYNPDDIRLIAAAPELLHELKYLLAEWEESIAYEPDYMHLGDAARAVIAKAEGRAE